MSPTAALGGSLVIAALMFILLRYRAARRGTLSTLQVAALLNEELGTRTIRSETVRDVYMKRASRHGHTFSKRGRRYHFDVSDIAALRREASADFPGRGETGSSVDIGSALQASTGVLAVAYAFLREVGIEPQPENLEGKGGSGRGPEAESRDWLLQGEWARHPAQDILLRWGTSTDEAGRLWGSVKLINLSAAHLDRITVDVQQVGAAPGHDSDVLGSGTTVTPNESVTYDLFEVQPNAGARTVVQVAWWCEGDQGHLACRVSYAPVLPRPTPPVRWIRSLSESQRLIYTERLSR